VALFPVLRTVKLCARLEAEQGFQVKLANQVVDSRLAVFTLYLRQYQAGAVAVVAAAHVGLYGEEFAGFFQCHSFPVVP
jgi:hypothetical protein